MNKKIKAYWLDSLLQSSGQKILSDTVVKSVIKKKDEFFLSLSDKTQELLNVLSLDADAKNNISCLIHKKLLRVIFAPEAVNQLAGFLKEQQGYLGLLIKGVFYPVQKKELFKTYIIEAPKPVHPLVQPVAQAAVQPVAKPKAVLQKDQKVISARQPVNKNKGPVSKKTDKSKKIKLKKLKIKKLKKQNKLKKETKLSRAKLLSKKLKKIAKNPNKKSIKQVAQKKSTKAKSLKIKTSRAKPKQKASTKSRTSRPEQKRLKHKKRK